MVASTWLRRSDPVVRNICADDGLVIGADNIVLDCRGLTLGGDGDQEGRGIVLDSRRRVTIQRCRITAFDDGIYVLNSGRNKLLRNESIENSSTGIRLHGDSDGNMVLSNKLIDNDYRGLAINGRNDGEDRGDRNVIKANTAIGNGRSGIGSGIQDCLWCLNNQFIANVTSETRPDNVDRQGQDTGVGMFIQGTDGPILGNWGSRNTGTGLLVKGSGNKLLLNTFNRNGGNGICATTGNTSVGGNHGRDNAETDVVLNAANC